MAAEEGREPLCWIVITNGTYYPLAGAGDWQGCFFTEAALEEYLLKHPVTNAEWDSRTVVTLFDDGSWEENHA